jgi:phage tail tape-measure protein
MLKVSLLIQMVEKVTAPVRRIRAAVRGMSRDGQRDISRFDRAMNRLRGTAARVGTAFRFANVRSSLASLMTQIRILSGRAGMRGLELAARGAGFAVMRTLRMAGGFAVRGALLAGGGLGVLGGFLTAGVIKTASKFEQFQVILENTEGSAAGAKKAMAWVQDFAQRTPYELDEVMRAFVQLKAYGIDPVNGTLESLGNAASGMGKDLMSAIEMIADAQTGEFERIKEFGVKAKVAGDQVTFTYMKAGKEIKKTAKNSAIDIQHALLGIFDERFKGMMDRQSLTVAGMWSNIQDAFTKFQKSIADAGIFDWVKGKLTVLLDKINELAKSGELQAWAEKISKWMERAGQKVWDFATKTDWVKLGSDLSEVGNAIMNVAKAVNFLARNMNMLASGGTIGFKLMRLFQYIPGAAIPGAAILPSFFGGPRSPPAGGGASGPAPRGNGLRGLRGFPAPGQRSPQPRSIFDTRPRGAPVRQSSPVSLLRRTSVDSRSQVDLRIRADRLLDVRATGMKSDKGTRVSVSRGPLAVA